MLQHAETCSCYTVNIHFVDAALLLHVVKVCINQVEQETRSKIQRLTSTRIWSVSEPSKSYHLSINNLPSRYVSADLFFLSTLLGSSSCDQAAHQDGLERSRTEYSSDPAAGLQGKLRFVSILYVTLVATGFMLLWMHLLVSRLKAQCILFWIHDVLFDFHETRWPLCSIRAKVYHHSGEGEVEAKAFHEAGQEGLSLVKCWSHIL